MPNVFHRLGDSLAAGNRRSAEFNRTVQAHSGLMAQQGQISEQAAGANHGRHMELVNAMNAHETVQTHAAHTHEAKMSAVNAKADVSRISAHGANAVNLANANWGGANEMARTVGSYAPEAARSAFTPMNPPAQPVAPTFSEFGSGANTEPAAETPKRVRKPKDPQGSLF